MGTRQVIEAQARLRLQRRAEASSKGKSEEESGPAPHRTLRGAIDFNDVVFSYPSRPGKTVLDGLDLHLVPGETFALVGPSGGGKSTVGALLVRFFYSYFRTGNWTDGVFCSPLQHSQERFYDPSEGTVCLDGVSVSAHDLSWLRRNIGVVSQDPTMFAGTVAENIAYARPHASRAEVEAAAAAANAHG